MRTVDQEQDARELGLPPSVQEALGELVSAAKDGLLALSVGVGLGVLAEMMQAEVDDVVGPKGQRNPDRAAVRHGYEGGEVTLGGRRVGVQRPRARTADGGSEVALKTYAHFADRDPLTRVVLEQMLAGVSTRRFSRTREPVGEEVLAAERSTSKSAVSREFVGRTREHLDALMSRPLGDMRLAAIMLDGIELKGRCCVVCLGITTAGIKVPLGLWDGSTENKTVAAHLLSDLVGRGLDVEQGVLVVLDGSKALRAAVSEVFGPVPVHRCARDKERNVVEHLAERDRPAVKMRLRKAWASENYELALDGLRLLAGELDRSYPGAAASLKEGMEETLTLTRLGIGGKLKTTLQSTNPIESMIETVRRTSRNVKRWQNGDMCLRWTAAGMLEAEQQFRKIIGYADLAKLALAVERDLLAARAAVHTTTSQEAATRATAS
ncbi:IS256 family transposase [Capillimicrobium parvum]|uniref:Mutator family transposase n=1 Tax=Capillimicrobium parvum TaxID=2884022 RepID=A0A9E7C1K5_9ACTN|nr:IS256 family transposase [Capillimicrobium parvum]UGS36523.1 IS256 family transposase ISMtu1 [Capillimicrobium parvum]